jgi:co-chaperonin GroES (HSP10)
VLVERLEDEETRGSIVIPATVRNPEVGLRRGKVVACGPGDRLVHAGLPDRAPMNVSPGDTVLYTRVPANDVKIGGRMYTMCHEEQHIYAVLDASE